MIYLSFSMGLFLGIFVGVFVMGWLQMVRDGADTRDIHDDDITSRKRALFARLPPPG